MLWRLELKAQRVCRHVEGFDSIIMHTLLLSSLVIHCTEVLKKVFVVLLQASLDTSATYLAASLFYSSRSTEYTRPGQSDKMLPD